MRRRAFTIIEVIVSIVILFVITVVSIGGFTFRKKAISLEKDTQELLSDLRKAQIMALSGIVLEDGNLPDGYGLYLKKNFSSYIFFADLNKDKIYSEEDKKIEEKVFSSKVAIESINIGKSIDSLYVDFQLPQGSISLKETVSSIEETQATISLKHSGLNFGKKISINAVSEKISLE